MGHDASLRTRIRVGAIFAITFSLAITAAGAFHPAVIEHYADSPDSVGITQWAERATGADMLRWWAGTWIQADSYYYRPLSSYLFYLEYTLFGWNFQGHVIISWLLHGGIALCVYLLALRLFPGPRSIARWTAMLAAVLFNLRLTPEGPHWEVAPVGYAVVAWWPAQTDQTSLFFSLLAILALDRWLQDEDRRGLLKAAVLWVISLLFKEMAIILPAIAGLLALYRHGLPALRPMREIERDGETSRVPGSAWLIVVPTLAFALGFLALRSALIPHGWGIESKPLDFYPRKLLFLLAARPYTLLVSYYAWLPVAAIFISAALYVWLRLPRRPAVIWLILSITIGSGLIAEALAGNFALVTIPDQLAALGTLTLLALGLLVLAHVRPAWPWLLLAMALVIHLPLLWVWGPHYFYWPAAFWAFFNAGLWHYVLLRADAGTLRWPQRAHSGESDPDLDSASGQGV